MNNENPFTIEKKKPYFMTHIKERKKLSFYGLFGFLSSFSSLTFAKPYEEEDN